MKTKEEARRELLQLRSEISEERRQEARDGLVAELYPALHSFSNVLSFASKGQEIDLWPLNCALAREGRLLLPRLVGATEMLALMVRDFACDLVIHPKWGVFEPHPERCPTVPFDRIACVLTPGLGFDLYRQRLGYGKGFYDRFLAKLHCPFYGVGFNEQYLDSPISTQLHDIPLSALYLF